MFAEAELLGNLTVVESSGNAVQNFFFAFTELIIPFRLRGLQRRLRFESLENHLNLAGIGPDLPLMNREQAFAQHLDGPGPAKNSPSPAAESVQHQIVLDR